MAQIMQFINLMNQQQAQEQPASGGGSGLLTGILGGGAGAGGVTAMGGGSAGGASVATPIITDVVRNAGTAATTTGGSAGTGAALATMAPYAGAIAGAALLGKGASDLIKDEKPKGAFGNASRAQLAWTTGGLSELGRASGLFGGKSTKQRQSEKWNKLYKDGKVPDWFMQQDVVQDMGVDDKKIASGKLGGRDVWATSAFFDQFGKGWSTAGDEGKREQVAKRILDEGLLDTRKGLTRFTDQNKVQSIYDEVIGGKKPTAQAPFLPVPKPSGGIPQGAFRPLPQPGQDDMAKFRKLIGKF